MHEGCERGLTAGRGRSGKVSAWFLDGHRLDFQSTWCCSQNRKTSLRTVGHHFFCRRRHISGSRGVSSQSFENRPKEGVCAVCIHWLARADTILTCMPRPLLIYSFVTEIENQKSLKYALLKQTLNNCGSTQFLQMMVLLSRPAKDNGRARLMRQCQGRTHLVTDGIKLGQD
jgi:hypothetical protein